MKDSYTQISSKRAATTLGKDRYFNVSVRLICTKETFHLHNIYNEMKIRELKSYCEFVTGIPLHLQKLNYLDQGDLLDHLDVKSCDLVPGGQLHMDVWNMWRRLVEAVATNDAEWVFQLGVTDSSEYATPNSEYMGAKAKKQWLADRAFVALYIASHRGHHKLCEKLIAAGANVNDKTPLGRTALHVAAACGHGNIVDSLLENGAEIDAEDSNGDSALSIANKFGNKDCERHLFLFRWQQRAKQTRTQVNHEMFAHQYFDSATPVWLKGNHSQIYYTQIMPPGEYEGTALSAPKRQQIHSRRGGENDSDDESESSRMGIDDRQHTSHRGDGATGMPPILEEFSGRGRGGRLSKGHAKGKKDKKTKTTSFDDWLERKKEVEQRHLETQKQEKKQKRLQEDDKQRQAEMQDKSYDQWLAEKEVSHIKVKTKPTAGPVSKVQASSGGQTTDEVIKKILVRREKEAEERGQEAAAVEEKFNFWMSSDNAHLYKHIKSHGPGALLNY